MTCWRTINLAKDYGFHRIVLISIITMFFTFVLIYIPLNLMHPNAHLNEDGILFFLTGCLIVFPVHKLLHGLPLFILRKKFKLTASSNILFMPVLTIRLKQTLSKSIIITALIMPFLLITSLMLIGSFMFPGYIHYFSIIAALNLGLCVPDLICLRHVLQAPKTSQIEEVDDGYSILVNN
ncbi:DUF3267 domain-containing protein [Cytobacillus suaedae]|nr:DUF3267 domain-containing protein [Cytobacillus suaedae]